MPKQLSSSYNEVIIPFQKMSFTPDVPAAALGPNEYNDGVNVETDVRGIRSMAGDQEILDTLPAGSGAPTFITGGFRNDGYFWFVVATQADPVDPITFPGQYLAFNPTTQVWDDITPNDSNFDSSGYNQATNITEAWNGNVLFLNDEQNPPFFWPDQPGAIMVSYSNISPLEITSITVATNPVNRVVTFTNPDSPSIPFGTSSKILLQGINPRYYDGTYTVIASTDTTVEIACDIAQPFVSGDIAPLYTWNYNPNWSGVFAKFMRMYNTPNVGSILVAGNLTATNIDTSIEIYPVTVQWSQAFGLNEAPTTWTPTVTNVANQLEVPLRGPALDAFPCNGQFFLCSYWDTVVFSPINYSTTSAPILGVRQFNQGRGLLSSNCWANTDKLVYGVDARDIWVFDGQDFKGLGNQRVKNWFYDQLDPLYYDRVFMETNTQRSQVEIYYPDSDAVGGVPNKMLSYRYDLDCWNAPRDISDATFSCESPIWTYDDPDWITNDGSRTVVYARGVAESKIVQKDQGFSFINDAPIASSFRRDNIKLLKDYSGKLMVHRILPEVVNLGADPFTPDDEIPVDPATSTNLGNVTVTLEGAGSVGAVPTSKPVVTMATNTESPWCQFNQNAYRVNNIEISNTSNNSVWMCTATTWQFTQVEDDR
jgi:hypothetical protein